jgi:hypothetical protein
LILFLIFYISLFPVTSSYPDISYLFLFFYRFTSHSRSKFPEKATPARLPFVPVIISFFPLLPSLFSSRLSFVCVWFCKLVRYRLGFRLLLLFSRM